jgi:hypothetical protein
MPTLRQRMLDAMVLRGFRPRTRVSHLRAVAQMASHYHRSPERITDEEIKAYLLHLVKDCRLVRASVNHNQASSAVRFLVCEVLGQADRRSRIPMALTPQKLPDVWLAPRQDPQHQGAQHVALAAGIGAAMAQRTLLDPTIEDPAGGQKTPRRTPVGRAASPALSRPGERAFDRPSSAPPSRPRPPWPAPSCPAFSSPMG